MSLVNENGWKISNEELEVIEEMLSGSIDSHIARMNKLIERSRDKEDAERFYRPIIAEYEKAQKDLRKRCREVYSSGEAVGVSGFMTGYLDDIAKRVVPKVDQSSEAYRDFAVFTATGFGNPEYLAMAAGPGGPVPEFSQDKEESYQETIENFRLSDYPMKGIEKIAPYDPATDSVKTLYSQRTGNSTTMKTGIEELERQKEEIINNNGLNEREKNNRIKKIDERIDAYKKGTFGINTAAEVARIHAVELANKPRVSTADLFRAFSELNVANRPAEPLAGKLRGTDIHAGSIQGVSASRAPAILYKTLDLVAEHMNAIKLITDPALRKTRAVELAAFADGMLLSEHVFADTNGRTCRMFADTILQSFGLPPHTPMKDMSGESATRTLGETMDFKKKAQILFTGIEKSDQVLKESKPEEDKAMDAVEAEKYNARAAALRKSVKGIADEAKERLRALEGMSKNGHVNGDEYKAMRDALRVASALDPLTDNITAVERALNDIENTSKEYQKTHSGWFRANSDYGSKRLGLSKDNQKFVDAQREMLREQTGYFDKMTAMGNLQKTMPQAAGKDDLQKAPPQAADKGINNKVKSVKLKELELKEGKKEKTVVRRRSNTFDGKKRVMEKKAAGKDMVL